MFIVRNTFYKDFNYLALSIYIAWSLFSYVFTIGMMTRFYLKMRKQNVSSMLRIYQFVWIYLCIAATTCFGFRSLDVYEITGWFFEIIFKKIVELFHRVYFWLTFLKKNLTLKMQLILSFFFNYRGKGYFNLIKENSIKLRFKN